VEEEERGGGEMRMASGPIIIVAGRRAGRGRKGAPSDRVIDGTVCVCVDEGEAPGARGVWRLGQGGHSR